VTLFAGGLEAHPSVASAATSAAVAMIALILRMFDSESLSGWLLCLVQGREAEHRALHTSRLRGVIVTVWPAVGSALNRWGSLVP